MPADFSTSTKLKNPAKIHLAYAAWHEQSGNYQEARLEYLASFELLKEIVELVPTNREYEQKLVYTLQLLVEQFPTRLEYQRDLARTHFKRGEMLERDGMWDESCKEYALAREKQKKLLQQCPAEPQYQRELADTHYKLGKVLGGLPIRDEASGNANSGLNKPERVSKGLHGSDKKRDEARKEYVEAIEIQKKLVGRFSDVPERQQELADIQIDLGILLASQSHWQAARVEFVSAMNLKKTLAARFPNETAHQVDLASIYGHFGNAIRDAGKPAVGSSKT